MGCGSGIRLLWGLVEVKEREMGDAKKHARSYVDYFKDV